MITWHPIAAAPHRARVRLRGYREYPLGTVTEHEGTGIFRVGGWVTDLPDGSVITHWAEESGA